MQKQTEVDPISTAKVKVNNRQIIVNLKSTTVIDHFQLSDVQGLHLTVIGLIRTKQCLKQERLNISCRAPVDRQIGLEVTGSLVRFPARLFLSED